MIDQYIAKCDLVKGTNRILIKICQNEQTEPWARMGVSVSDHRPYRQRPSQQPMNEFIRRNPGHPCLLVSGREPTGPTRPPQNTIASAMTTKLLTLLNHIHFAYRVPAIMRSKIQTSSVACGFCFFLTGLAAAAEPVGWLGFRGDGTSAAAAAPATLAVGDGGNLAWQRQMPGSSVAGPIVIGDLVVSTSSSGQDGEAIFVSGIDLVSGQVRWEQSFRATGRPFCHPTSANAAPTSVSDGERIYAFFSSNDLVCLSLDGELLWYRGLGFDYPKAGNDIGMASSPVVASGVVVVQVESQGDSFAAGIDGKTGENLWRMDRPKISNWSSPVAIHRPDGTVEVVLCSQTDVIAVDPRTGSEKWKIDEGRAEGFLGNTDE